MVQQSDNLKVTPPVSAINNSLDIAFGVKCVDYSCYVVYLNDYYNWHMEYESHETLACSVSDVSDICI